MDGQLHAPNSLPPGKELMVPIVQEAGCAPSASLDAVDKVGTPCPCRKLSPGHPIHDPSLYHVSHPSSFIRM
jgi:hypothetical protein